MHLLGRILLRAVGSVGFTLTVFSVSNAAVQAVTIGSFDAQMLPTRLRIAASRPAHIPTIGLRAGRTGDTAPSSKYYKLTNISAEVGSATGYTVALNNDGRILYVDESLSNPFQFQSYLVNNGGTFASLPFPFTNGAQLYVQASAINENGEAVGNYAYEGSYREFNANVAWSLSGGTGVRVAYFGGYRNNSAVFGLNDEDIAVGYDGLNSVAAMFIGASQPAGRVIDLKRLPESCASSAVAQAINDAGEIVGGDCNIAVIFSPTAYARAFLPAGPKGTGSYASAINEAGDIVGGYGASTVSNRAFLYHLGKMTLLPMPADCDGGAGALAVNATDEVVGDCGTTTQRPFVYISGRSFDLNTLIAPDSGWQLVDALGINDHGEIIGTGYYNGTYYGISLKPPSHTGV